MNSLQKIEPHELAVQKPNPAIGIRFGMLAILSVGEKKYGNKYWVCRCDCGKVKSIQDCANRSGKIMACGCMIGKSSSTHGLSSSKTYEKWGSMIGRCSIRATAKTKANYWSRGIRICDRWKKFESFLDDMGECPEGLELDRKNNDLGYYQGNCRLTSRKENQCNKRTSRVLLFNGVKKSISIWANDYRINVNTLRKRLRLGWDIQKALQLPAN